MKHSPGDWNSFEAMASGNWPNRFRRTRSVSHWRLHSSWRENIIASRRSCTHVHYFTLCSYRGTDLWESNPLLHFCR